MGSAGGKDEGPKAAKASAKPDRRAEALRANLQRRKAQTRARDEAQRDVPQSDASGPED